MRVWPKAYMLIALMAPAIPVTASAAENVECVRGALSAPALTELDRLARTTPADLPRVTAIIAPIALDCGESNGWSEEAVDDALKYTYFQIVVETAESADGIPLAVRQRADMFIAQEPADTVDRLVDTDLTGQPRIIWLERLFRATFPDQSVSDPPAAVTSQFYLLISYILARRYTERRLAAFRAR